MNIVKGLLGVVRVAIKLALIAGVLAVVGAGVYALAQKSRGGSSTSFENFPEVPVNPLANQAA